MIMKMVMDSNNVDVDMHQRLLNIESDLGLILAIKDVLMMNSNEGNNSNDLLEHIPVKDTPMNDHKNKGIKKRVQSQGSKIPKSTTKSLPPETGSKKDKGDGSSSNVPSGQEQRREEDSTNNLHNIHLIKQTVEREIQKRLEVEESAKIMMVRLQTVEDDLTREKQTKRSLLEGTLQLKNQMQSYQSQISQMEKMIKDTEEEKEKLSLELSHIQNQMKKVASEYEKQLKVLENEKESLEVKSTWLNKDLELQKSKCQELEMECERMRQSQTQNKSHLQNELVKCYSKCNELEEQRKANEWQLNISREKLENVTKALKSAESQLAHETGKWLHNLKEKKSLIESLIQERSKMTSKIDSATELLSKTKGIIVTLKEEKVQAKNESRKMRSENQLLQAKVQSLTKEVSTQGNLRERFWSMNNEHKEKLRCLMEERDRVLKELKAERNASEKFMRAENRLKDELVKGEECKAQLEKVIQDLKDELSRISSNFQILQKVSEDQTKTISKQRSELCGIREKFETDLRQTQENERSLNLRLTREEKYNRELESQISLLESKLSAINKEIKDHDCEETVDSKYLEKTRHLERKIRGMVEEIKSKDEERDKAVAAAKKAMNQTTSIQESCDHQLQKMRRATAQQILRIQEEKQQQEIEAHKKMRSLEDQLAKTEDSYRQMQNAYMCKIQGLQNALNACVQQNNIGFMIPATTPSSTIPSSCAANFNFSSGLNNRSGNPFHFI